jgi:hypothetical protein
MSGRKEKPKPKHTPPLMWESEVEHWRRTFKAEREIVRITQSRQAQQEKRIDALEKRVVELESTFRLLAGNNSGGDLHRGSSS